MKTGHFDLTARPLSGFTSSTRRQLLRGAAACAAATFLSSAYAFGRDAASEPAEALNPQPIPEGPVTHALLTVSRREVGSIGNGFAGFSYEKGVLCTPLLSASNANLISLYKRLDPATIRLGGNHVDTTVWTPRGAGQTPGQIAPSDVDAFASFVKATGWQVIYSINLGGSATGATNPTLAADEVAYARRRLGPYLMAVVIGNEPGNYGAPGHYYAGNWSLSKFENLWSQYRAAILTRTPDAPIAGPSMAVFKQLDRWTLPFAHDIGKRGISILTQHYYRGDASQASVENMIQPDPQLVNGLAKLNRCSQEVGVPFRLTECNSYYGYNIKRVLNTYASSLWIIDFLFQCARGGTAGVNMHSTPSGGGYAPIAFSGGNVLAAHPEYYGMLLFTLAGQGTLCATQLSAGNLNATAYALKTRSGSLNLVINNKDLTNNLNLTIELPQSASSARLLELTQHSAGAMAPDLTANSGVTLQGGTVGADGSFSPSSTYTLSPKGAQLDCYVPALSAVLIQIA